MRNRKSKGPGKMSSMETSNVSKGMSEIEQIPLEKKSVTLTHHFFILTFHYHFLDFFLESMAKVARM
jgi:hypothetical protein